MNRTIGELLDWLELPENEGQIKHLENFQHLKYVEETKKIRGLGGLIAKFALHLARKHIDAFMALAECKTPADIAAFKKTAHFDKIKDNADWGNNLEDLKELEELKELEQLHIKID